jgi:hypothetical protein
MAGDPVVVHNAFRLSGLSITDLWIRYIGLGGTLTLPDLEMYLTNDDQILPVGQYNVIVHTINERFMEMDLNHPIPYDPP